MAASRAVLAPANSVAHFGFGINELFAFIPDGKGILQGGPFWPALARDSLEPGAQASGKNQMKGAARGNLRR
jgi:hypothetical protein